MTGHRGGPIRAQGGRCGIARWAPHVMPTTSLPQSSRQVSAPGPRQRGAGDARGSPGRQEAVLQGPQGTGWAARVAAPGADLGAACLQGDQAHSAAWLRRATPQLLRWEVWATGQTSADQHFSGYFQDTELGVWAEPLLCSHKHPNLPLPRQSQVFQQLPDSLAQMTTGHSMWPAGARGRVPSSLL